VWPTHQLGKGFPDIAVGYQGRNYLFEIKDPAQEPARRRLTEDEADWHLAWRGQVHVIETSRDAMIILGMVKGTPDDLARIKSQQIKS